MSSTQEDLDLVGICDWERIKAVEIWLGWLRFLDARKYWEQV